MMKNRRVLLGVLVVVAIIALTATATYAYFSGTDNSGNDVTVALATIGVQATAGMPVELRGLLPGESSADKIFTVQNTGTAPIDVYAWLVGTYDAQWNGLDEANFCQPQPFGVKATIWNEAQAWLYNDDVCGLFPISNGKALRLVSGLQPGASASFGLRLTLPTTLGNQWQGAWNVSPVTFMATQVGVAPTGANYGPQVVYIPPSATPVSQSLEIW
jgi:predicted ribosomally synthesized peptide with SipW-like signal peptide